MTVFRYELPGNRFYLCPLRLRPQQEELIRFLDEAMLRGELVIGLQARTGFGKTLPLVAYTVMLVVRGVSIDRLHDALVGAVGAEVVAYHSAWRPSISGLRAGAHVPDVSEPSVLPSMKKGDPTTLLYCSSTVQQLEQVGNVMTCNTGV